MTAKKLIRLRKKAEEAASGVVDEQLRITAFDVILRHLLKEADKPKQKK
jgi:hypothetical protein